MIAIGAIFAGGIMLTAQAILLNKAVGCAAMILCGAGCAAMAEACNTGLMEVVWRRNC